MFFANLKKVLRRELRQMFARPIYIFSSVIMMGLACFFFLSLLKGGVPERLPIAIVDHDHSTISRRFAHELNATSSVEIKSVYETYAEARQAMQRGDIYAFIELPDGLYSDLLANRRPCIAFYTNNAYVIGANLTYKQLLTMANLASGAVQREVLRAKGKSEDAIMDIIQPIVIDGHLIGNPYGSYAVYLLSTILPGILGLIILMLTVFSIGYELKMRTSRQWLAAAGGSYTTAMIGKMLPYSILFVVLGIACDILMFRFMHFPVAGSLLWLALGMVVYVLSMQAIGITLIGLFPVLRDGVSAGALYGMMSFSLSGFTYPVSGMLPCVQALTYLFPLRHYFLIYVNEAMMGASIVKTLPSIGLLLCFQVLPLLVSKRLHNALVYQNYPLK